MHHLFNPEGKIMKVMNWITIMVRLQFYWIIHLLFGMIVVGVFPATAALYEMHISIIKGDIGKVSLFNFYERFKANFLKSNLMGYISVLFVVFSGIHLRLSANIQSNFGVYFIFVSYALLLNVVFLNIYIWPTMAKYQTTIIDTFKKSLILIFVRPFYFFVILIMQGILVAFFYRLLIVLPIALVAVDTFFIAWIHHKAILSIQNDAKGDL